VTTVRLAHVDPTEVKADALIVGVVRRKGRTLGVVLLNSRDPAKHAPKLLDAAFARL